MAKQHDNILFEKRFNGESYNQLILWRKTLHLVLKSKKLNQCILDSGFTSAEFADQVDPLFNTLEKRIEADERAQIVIMASVSESINLFIMECNNAYDMYKAINDNFDETSTNTFQLLMSNQTLTDLKYEESETNPIKNHLTLVLDEIKKYESTGNIMPMVQKCNYLIQGLPKVYTKILKDACMGDMKTLYTWSFIEATLKSNYQQRLRDGDIGRDIYGHKVDEIQKTYYANNTGGRSGASNNNNKYNKQKSIGPCWFCNKMGHTKINCRECPEEEKKKMSENYTKRINFSNKRKQNNRFQPYSKSAVSKMSQDDKKALLALLMENGNAENEAACVTFPVETTPNFRDHEDYLKDLDNNHQAHFCSVTNHDVSKETIEIRKLTEPGIQPMLQPIPDEMFGSRSMKYKYKYTEIKKSNKSVRVKINGVESTITEGSVLPCHPSEIKTLTENGGEKPFVYYYNVYGKNFCSFENITIPKNESLLPKDSSGNILQPTIPIPRKTVNLEAEVVKVNLQKLYVQVGDLIHDIVLKSNGKSIIGLQVGEKLIFLRDGAEINFPVENAKLLYGDKLYPFTYYTKTKVNFTALQTTTESTSQICSENTMLHENLLPTSESTSGTTTATQTPVETNSESTNNQQTPTTTGVDYDSEESYWSSASDCETPNVPMAKLAQFGKSGKVKKKAKHKRPSTNQPVKVGKSRMNVDPRHGKFGRYKVGNKVVYYEFDKEIIPVHPTNARGLVSAEEAEKYSEEFNVTLTNAYTILLNERQQKFFDDLPKCDESTPVVQSPGGRFYDLPLTEKQKERFKSLNIETESCGLELSENTDLAELSASILTSKPKSQRELVRDQMKKDRNAPAGTSRLNSLNPDLFTNNLFKYNELNDYLSELQKPQKCHYTLLSKGTPATNMSDTELSVHLIADSGATSHVSDNKKYFTRLLEAPTNYSLMCGGNTPLKIEGIGDIKFNVLDSNGKIKTIILKRVLYVPTMGCNLYSVRKGLINDGIITVFDLPERCTFKVQQPNSTAFTFYGHTTNTCKLYQVQIHQTDHGLVVQNPKHLALQKLWHRRLGHPHFASMKKMVTDESVVDFKLLDPTCSCKMEPYFCECCVMGKSQKKKYRTDGVERAAEILDKVYVDIEIFNVPSFDGYIYLLVFVDDHSRFVVAYPLRSKDEIYEKYEHFRVLVGTKFHTNIKNLEYINNGISDSTMRDDHPLLKRDPAVLQMDHALEFEKLGNIVKEHGTHFQFRLDYEPQQAGVVERKMRPLCEKLRAIMWDADLPRQLWPEICDTVIYLMNLTPSKACKKSTPYEMWHKKKPSVAHLRIFGCIAYAHVPEELRQKLDWKAKKYMFIGYAEHFKAYRLLDMQTLNIAYSRHVDFNENTMGNISKRVLENYLNHCQQYYKKYKMFYVRKRQALRPIAERRIIRSLGAKKNDTTTLTQSLTEEDEYYDQLVYDTVYDNPVPDSVNQFLSTNTKSTKPSNIIIPVETLSSNENTPVASSTNTTPIAQLPDNNPEPSLADEPPLIIPEEIDFSLRRSTRTRKPNSKYNDNAFDQLPSPNGDPQFTFITKRQQLQNQLQMRLHYLENKNNRRQRYNSQYRNKKRREAYVLQEVMLPEWVLRSEVQDENASYEFDNMLPEKMYGLISERTKPFPKTLLQAMKRDDAAKWWEAANVEMNAHSVNGTWKYTKLPPGKKALQCRWVLVKKYKHDGTVERYKARLVVKGFLQQLGIDYDETYAPVIRMEILRMLLTMAANQDWECEQMDVKTAFLNSLVMEEIYMEQPDGFILKDNPDLVCKLLKCLYGLKQAPREWYKRLSDYLAVHGYKPLLKDQCVFIKVHPNGLKSIISVYVDDLLLFAPCKKIISEIKNMMTSEFKMTDLGEVKQILGWRITRNRKERTIFIDQEQYANKVLERFDFAECRTSKLPMAAGERLTKDLSPLTENEINYMKTIPYREAVGSFMYLMVGTRPDLSNFLREVSSHLCNPGMKHWEAVQKGLRYLKGTAHYGLTIGGGKSVTTRMTNNEDILKVYVDSDFSNCVDTRRSITGFAIYFVDSLISWCSRRQRSVTLSTTEAEYMAMAHALTQMIFLRQTLEEMEITQSTPVKILEDNKGCILLAKKQELNDRSRHVDNKYHFIQEQVRRKRVIVEYIQTKDQRADPFTKNLDSTSFYKHREALRVTQLQKE